MAQNWYTQYRENRAFRAGIITWEVCKRAFLDRFFPREKRESKVEEFINHRPGGLNVQEYYLKFTKMSKYAPSLVSNFRDEISRFVTRVFDDLVEECCSAMLHDSMYISYLMVHAYQDWN